MWPSRRVVVAALALGTAPLVAQAMAEERSDPWRSVARYDLEYRVRLRELGSAPDRVALWVPYPAETRDQRVLDASIDSPWPERLTREEKYGNRMVYAEGKADGAVRDLVMRFVVERRPSYLQEEGRVIGHHAHGRNLHTATAVGAAPHLEQSL